MEISENYLPNGLLMTPSATNIEPSKDRYEKRKKYRESIGRQWTAGGLAEQISYLQVASPVNHFPKLDEEKERQMTATSGLKCLELYESLNRYGSLLKTCVASLLGTTAWYSNKCALTWKAKVTKSNRLLFQLSPSMRHTEGIESGLLPTADGNMGARGEMKQWVPVRPSGHHASLTLNDKIKMLPTPNARDTRGKSIKRDRVPDIVEGHNRPIGQQTGLKLQPSFVEWMMGYPKDWTEIPDSKLLEMRLSRKSQKKL